MSRQNVVASVIVMLVGIVPATAQTSATLKGHKHTITSLAHAPDGKTLASGSKDETVILWDLTGKKPRATLAGHKDMVITVRFSPDSKTVASVSHDDLILLWDAANGDKLGSLHGHD